MILWHFSLDVDNFSKGFMCLSTSGIIHKSKFLPGTVEKNSYTLIFINPSEKLSTSSEKCHKIIMIYPQPIRRHYHPKYTLITLAPVSYFRSLVVGAVHRHRTGVGSIPAGGPYIVDEFFSIRWMPHFTVWC